jgi:hypothetical protein
MSATKFTTEKMKVDDTPDGIFISLSNDKWNGLATFDKSKDRPGEGEANAKLFMAAASMYAALSKLQKRQERVILQTASGEERNHMTQENIEALAALLKAV